MYQSKAKRNKLYPELSVGDRVKIKRKKTITEKERTSNFLQGEYIVEEIFEKLNQKYYKLMLFDSCCCGA